MESIPERTFNRGVPGAVRGDERIMECDIFESMSPDQKASSASTSSEKVMASIVDNNLKIVLACEANRVLNVLGCSCVDTDRWDGSLLAGLSGRWIPWAAGNSVVGENVCFVIGVLHYPRNFGSPGGIAVIVSKFGTSLRRRVRIAW
jgi:hypothetical protein